MTRSSGPSRTPTGRRPRNRIAPALTALVALAVATAGLAVTPAAAEDEPSEPSIVVSKTSGFDPEGSEVVTVTGTGFTDTANGTRPPLSGQPAGVYVVFGRFAEVWQPSEDAPTASRQVISQRWALPQAAYTQLNPTGTNASYVLIEEDGSFTAELTVEAAEGTGDYGVVTYPGSGGTKAEHELHQPLTFAGDGDGDGDDGGDGGDDGGDPVDGPDGSRTVTGPNGQTLSVVPANNLDPEGQEVTVTGTGYDPDLGVYVSLCVDNGPGQVPSPCVGGVDMEGGSSSSAFISNNPAFEGLATPWGAGGTFEVTLTIAAADEHVDCLDGTVTCKVLTRADHTATANRSADVKVPVHWAGQDPIDEEETETEDPAPATLDRSVVRPGEDITVSGEGFLPGEQVQVWVLSEPRLLAVVEADRGGVATATVTIPLDLEPGEHHIELRGVTSGLVVRSAPFTVLAAEAESTDPPATTPPATSPAGTSPPGATLPRTGGDAGLVPLGLALLLAGTAAVLVARRRAGSPA